MTKATKLKTAYELTDEIISSPLPLLSQLEKHLLLTLASKTNAERDAAYKCWPTNLQLAEQLGIAKVDTINRNLKSLEQKGHIVRDTKYYEEVGGRRRIIEVVPLHLAVARTERQRPLEKKANDPADPFDPDNWDDEEQQLFVDLEDEEHWI